MGDIERESANGENSQEERRIQEERRRREVFNNGRRCIMSFADSLNREDLQSFSTDRMKLVLNRTAESFSWYLVRLFSLVNQSIEGRTNLINDMENGIVPASERRNRELINNIPGLEQEINYIMILYSGRSGAFTDDNRSLVEGLFGELRRKVSELSNKNLEYNSMTFKNSLKAFNNKFNNELSCKDVDRRDIDSQDARTESNHQENGIESSSSEEDEREPNHLIELTTLNSELSSSAVIGF